MGGRSSNAEEGRFINPPTPWGHQACGIILVVTTPPIVLPVNPQKSHLAPTPRAETGSSDSALLNEATTLWARARVSQAHGPKFN